MLKALEDSRQGVGLQESKLRKLESARLRERQSERERTKLMEGENSRLEKVCNPADRGVRGASKIWDKVEY